MEACLRAVQAGVPAATVLDGRSPHALLLEIFTTEGIGTMVLPDLTGPDAGPAGSDAGPAGPDASAAYSGSAS
jgi:acetylglutamate kinase